MFMQSDVPDVLQDMRTITRETAGAGPPIIGVVQ